LPKPGQKIRHLYRLLIVLIGSCWFSLASAQSGRHTFVPFGPKDGLPSSEILYLFQDSKHYLWIGHAAGVSRYDGYTFENFLFSNNQRLGKTYCVGEDSRNDIWIATENGLFVYANEEITPFATDSSHPFAYSLVFDKRGGLWVATSTGPAYFSAQDLQNEEIAQKASLTHFIIPQWRKMFPLLNQAKLVSVDPSGNVFFSDTYCIYRFDGQRLQKSWETSISGNFLNTMIAPGPDSLYFTSAFGGLEGLENGQFRSFDNHTGNGNSVIEHNGQVYFYTTMGIYLFHPARRSIQQVIALPEGYQEWGSALCIDRENNFWIGTHELLLHATNKIFTVINLPLMEGFDELYSGCQLYDGTLVFGGNHGLFFKKTGHGFEPVYKNGQLVFPRAELMAMMQDKDSTLWIGSGYQGLAAIKNNQISHYTVKNGLRDNTNFFFLKTGKGVLYAAGDNGVSRIDRDAGGKVSFTNYFYKAGSTNYAVFRSGIETANGRLYFGCSWGLFEIKQDSLQPTTIVKADKQVYYITDIKNDLKGNTWISTIGDGILFCRADSKGNLVMQKKITQADGLPHNNFLRLLADKENKIWALGYNGISRLEAIGNNHFFIASFDKDNGFLQRPYHSATLLQSADGVIWIPTSSGLMYFNADQITHYINTPNVFIRRVEIEDHTQSNPVTTTLPALTDDLPSLTYDQNTISFSYSAIYLTDPQAVRYMYRLLGSDSNWVYAGATRSITFQNLPAGHYRFEVKAAAGTNRWSAVQSYSFTIHPPFWKRWWFLLLAIVILSVAAYFIVKNREKNIKLHEAQKTELQTLKAISYQYQLEIEQVVNYFATSMSGQRSVDDMLWDVARSCISKLGFEDCVIYLFDDKKQVLVQKAAWGPKTHEFNKIINPIEIPVYQGIVGAVAATGKAEIIHDTSIDKRYIVDDIRRYSEIAVPIINNGNVIGVIDSEHWRKHFYTERHLQILTTIASLVGDKIDKLKAEQEVREREIQLISLNRDLVSSQLTALRAQMNPHFIFNALNSVQQYILQGNVDQANKYLSKFSRLQREVLNHCDQNFITIEKEIEMLQLYLQLEQLRFQDNFNYTITVADDIDVNEIRLPPMMLQPFVENAIWHGLMPKQGSRRVNIDFSLPSDDFLHCTIRDNGIGRAAAARLKKDNVAATTHQSKGLRLVFERLQILEQQYQQPFEAIISDITDDEGIITGTQVKLILYIGN
jgi:two-component system LytT family sensor kinase